MIAHMQENDPLSGTRPSPVGVAVRIQLLKQGLSASQLADRVGISRSGMSRRLLGETDMTVGELFAIAEALGIKPVDLIAEAEKAAA